MSDPAFPPPCSSLPEILSKCWLARLARLLAISMIAMAVSWPFNALLAAPSGPSFSAFYPCVGFGEGWKTSVVLVNIGSNPTTAQLLAYDIDGNLRRGTMEYVGN